LTIDQPRLIPEGAAAAPAKTDADEVSQRSSLLNYKFRNRRITISTKNKAIKS
jgi:hypothetical protein